MFMLRGSGSGLEGSGVCGLGFRVQGIGLRDIRSFSRYDSYQYHFVGVH